MCESALHVKELLHDLHADRSLGEVPEVKLRLDILICDSRVAALRPMVQIFFGVPSRRWVLNHEESHTAESVPNSQLRMFMLQ